MITPEEAAEELLGTCKPRHDVVKEGEDDDHAWCLKFDDLVVNCEGCNWWCEPGEMNDDGLCGDCAEDQQDADD